MGVNICATKQFKLSASKPLSRAVVYDSPKSDNPRWKKGSNKITTKWIRPNGRSSRIWTLDLGIAVLRIIPMCSIMKVDSLKPKWKVDTENHAEMCRLIFFLSAMEQRQTPDKKLLFIRHFEDSSKIHERPWEQLLYIFFYSCFPFCYATLCSKLITVPSRRNNNPTDGLQEMNRFLKEKQSGFQRGDDDCLSGIPRDHFYRAPSH